MTQSNIARKIKSLEGTISALNEKEIALRKQKKALVKELQSLKQAEYVASGEATEDFVKIFGKLAVVLLTENTPLGDAIEANLTAFGPMTRTELIESLNDQGVPISPNSPHQVLANAIKRDPKKRFEILEDRRVGLKGRK